MSDNTGADAQTANASTPQAGTTTSNTTSQGTTPETVDALPRWAQDLIRETRKEAADNRIKLQKFEDANKTELEKAQSRANELEKTYGETITELQRERAERVIRDAATEANANPQRLAAIFRLVRDDIEYGDDGKPSNVSALITKAKKDSPEWFRSALGSGDGGKGGDTPADRNELVNAFIRGGR